VPLLLAIICDHHLLDALFTILRPCTGACGVFGAEFVATGHPPALLSQIPHEGFVAEDILPQKAAQMIQCCWPDNRWSDGLSTVQNFACGRGYLCAADGSSFCTLVDGVVGQMIGCTNNGRFVTCFDHFDLRQTAGIQ
jgi:hypothetical protein